MKKPVIGLIALVDEGRDSFWMLPGYMNGIAAAGGIGVMLVSLLRNEILREGKLPFYGAAVSHAISQSIAVRAGFVPAWAELTTRRIPV